MQGLTEWGQENVGVILKFNLRERKDALGAQYKINQKFDQIYRLIFSRFYLYQSSYYRFLVKASLVIKVKIVHYIQTKKLSTVQKCLSWKNHRRQDSTIPKKSSTFAPPPAQWLIRWENMQYESICSCNKYMYSSIS